MSEADVEIRKVEEMYMYLIEKAAKPLIRMKKSHAQSLRPKSSKRVNQNSFGAKGTSINLETKFAYMEGRSRLAQGRTSRKFYRNVM